MNYYEPGNYVFRITKQGWTEAKDGKPMLVFDGYPTHLVRKDPEGNEVLEEVYEDPQRPDRRLQLYIDSSRDDIMDFVMKKLRHAGFEGDSFADLNLLNTDIRATCKEDEYKSKPTENWDFALPPLERGEVNELDSGMNRKLDTLFGKRLKGGKPKQVDAEPQPVDEQQPEPVATPTANDDVPF